MHRGLEGISRFVGLDYAADWFKANADAADNELAGKGDSINPELTKKFGKIGSAAAGISTGAGEVGATAPAMLAGQAITGALGVGAGATMLVRAGKSALGMIPMAMQVMSRASAAAYDNALTDGKKSGEASVAAGMAALKTLPGLAAYIPGGALASKLTNLLPVQLTPLVKGIANTIFGSAANVGTSAVVRKMEGGDFAPTTEGLTQDIAFGIHGGIHGAHEQGQLIDTSKAILDGWHPQAALLDSITDSEAPQFTPDVKRQAAAALTTLRKNAADFLASNRIPVADANATAPAAMRAAHAEIDGLQPNEQLLPTQVGPTQDALRGLVKVATGQPIDSLTEAEKKALTSKHPDDNLPRIAMVKGPNGAKPVITDAALARVKAIAPRTAVLMPADEHSQRQAILNPMNFSAELKASAGSAKTASTAEPSQNSANLSASDIQRATLLSKVLSRNGVDDHTADIFARRFVSEQGAEDPAYSQRDAIKNAFLGQGGVFTESGQREEDADRANQKLRQRLQNPVSDPGPPRSSPGEIQQNGDASARETARIGTVDPARQTLFDGQGAPTNIGSEAWSKLGRTHVDDSLQAAWSDQRERFAKLGIHTITESSNPADGAMSLRHEEEGRGELVVNRELANQWFSQFGPEKAREIIQKGFDEEYHHALGARVADKLGTDRAGLWHDWSKQNPKDATALREAYGRSWDGLSDKQKFHELERMILQSRNSGKTTEQLWLGADRSAGVDRARQKFRDPVRLTDKFRQYFRTLLDHLRGDPNPSRAVLDHIRAIESFEHELRSGDRPNSAREQATQRSQAEELSFSMAKPNDDEIIRDPERAAADARKSPLELLNDAMPLASRIASAFRNIPGVDLQDIEQHARIAVARAAKAYGPEKGVPFEALARTSVNNELRDLYRKQMRVREDTTLDRPLSNDSLDTKASQIPDEVGRGPRDRAAYVESVDLLHKAIKGLPDRMRTVVQRLAAGDEPNAIANDLAVTKQAISNLKLAAIRRLRGKFGELGIIGLDDDGILRMANPAKAFYEQDLEPGFRAAGKGFVDTICRIAHVIAPRIGVPSEAIDAMGQMQGERTRAMYQLERLTKPLDKMFSGIGQKGMVDFVDRVKTGQAQTTPELQAVADMVRQIDTNTWNEAKKFKPSLSWLDNHFRVLWKTIPGSTKGGLTGLFRRPIEGSKGWAKQHTLDEMSQGLALGGEPLSYNPMVLFRAAQADMMKFISAQRMWEAYKDLGLRKFVKPGQDRPEGWQKIDDRIGSVYFPVKEGTVKAGDWYVEPGAARLLNNHLSRDYVREAAAGRGLLYLKNATTAAELAFSPFHAVFEGGEAIISNFGLGLNKTINRGLLQSDPSMFISGLKDMLFSPAAPYSVSHLGGAAVRSFDSGFWHSDEGKWLTKRFPGQDVRQMIEDGYNGGLKPSMHEDYKTNSVTAFLDSANSGNYLGAGLRVIPAINEVITSPLFEKFIPRLKWGLFLKEYSNELAIHADRLAAGKVSRTELARKVTDFVEDRFGELNFDNLYWNRTFKTSMQLLFRSVTWKLGSLRAAGGALPEQAIEFINAAKEHRAPVLNRKMTWLFGLAVGTVAMSSVIQKLMAGKSLESLKDILAPRVDPNDDTIRVTTPTYAKDIYHLSTAPAHYLESSTSGILNHIFELAHNRDFYGVKIHNEDDDWTKQAVDMGKYGAGMMLPFSIRGYRRMSDQDMSTSRKLLGAAGFSPAARAISQTPAESLASRFMEQEQETRGAQTSDAFEKSKMKSKLVKSARDGDVQPLREAVLSGAITHAEAQRLVSRAQLTPFQASVHSLSLPQSLRVFEAGTDEEKSELLPIVQRKNEDAHKRGEIAGAEYWENRNKLAGVNAASAASKPALHFKPSIPRAREMAAAAK